MVFLPREIAGLSTRVFWEPSKPGSSEDPGRAVAADSFGLQGLKRFLGFLGVSFIGLTGFIGFIGFIGSRGQGL